ncbi:hypothetical protein EVG20_g8348 [Dentipellis fragilis]|uniref:Uncharacterized protein n=1 Tax=Dentipellis fragilis TaxID=205917 RepID=A0A4Y9Y920_9AGAM|nr:hypothetical protein EVG20_g8348 [Dentipellis fragilis]
MLGGLYAQVSMKMSTCRAPDISHFPTSCRSIFESGHVSRQDVICERVRQSRPLRASLTSKAYRRVPDITPGRTAESETHRAAAMSNNQKHPA